MDKTSILNIEIHNLTQNDLLQSMNNGVLLTPNVDHLVKLQKNKLLFEVYSNAEWVICDSKIVYWSLKFLGTPVKETIPGSSLFPAYCDFHKSDSSVKIFLLGAGPGVASKAMSNINKRLESDLVVATHSPSYGFEQDEFECDEIISIINRSKATVLVVGLGAPKQEIWISKYKSKLPNIKLFMALGATIDFEAGNIKRAPHFFRRLSLEWFYRMCCDPKRLVKRYLVDDLPFFYFIIKQKLNLYKSPFTLYQDNYNENLPKEEVVDLITE
ncbi:WecB/TagA/CpsF family glycosyltransferase [Spirosoma horti]